MPPTVATTVVHINANLTWKWCRAQSGSYIGVCDPLKITLEADTFYELMEESAITLDALMKDLFMDRELDKFLREHGWTADSTIPDVPIRELRFDVPFDAMKMNGQQIGCYK